MNEAEVRIHLPESRTPVLAGRFRHDAGAARGEFAYDAAYLARADALELDPVELPLSDATFETERLGGVFGALRDAGPDHWGRSLLDAQASPGALDQLGYRLASSDDRAGALAFGDCAPTTPRGWAWRALAGTTPSCPGREAGLAALPGLRRDPTPAISEDRRDLAMACGVEGRRASAGNLLSECGRFGLGRDHAADILDRMEEAVRHDWRRVMAKCGVTDANCDRVARAFSYPRFRY